MRAWGGKGSTNSAEAAATASAARGWQDGSAPARCHPHKRKQNRSATQVPSISRSDGGEALARRPDDVKSAQRRQPL